MRKIRVIGVPRSGTNLVKYLIEINTDVRCFFNLGWWKHAIIPPLMYKQKIMITKIPTIIMFREPVRQIASFYNFASKGRSAMSSACDFRTFIASAIKMTPDKGAIEYCYSTPIDYWNQFYYAAINWNSGNKVFIDLEELQQDPRLIGAVLSKIFSEPRQNINPRLPEKYLGRNVDRPVSEGWGFEAGTTLDDENRNVNLLVNSLPAAEIASILTNRTTVLYERLRSARFLKN